CRGGVCAPRRRRGKPPPPRPPSPPSGPPSGTYFSRRKLTAPRPPGPALTSMSTSSMKGEPRLAVGSAGRLARQPRLSVGAADRSDRLQDVAFLDHLADREDGHRTHIGTSAVVARVIVSNR